MEELYRRNKVNHALIWIGVYLGISILAINLGDSLGINMFISAFIPLSILAIIMYLYIMRLGINKDIGLTNKYRISFSRMLYLIPLLFFALSPLLYGINTNLKWYDIATIFIMMLSVGFLEEVIFRGLLFNALLKKWRPITTIAFVSLTFGIGHITSLLVGKELIWTLIQIMNATIVGFMFLSVYVALNNSIPVIIAHGVYNFLINISLYNEISPGWLFAINTTISVLYSIYIICYLKSYNKILKPKKQSEPSV